MRIAGTTLDYYLLTNKIEKLNKEIRDLKRELQIEKFRKAPIYPQTPIGRDIYWDYGDFNKAKKAVRYKTLPVRESRGTCLFEPGKLY